MKKLIFIVFTIFLFFSIKAFPTAWNGVTMLYEASNNGREASFYSEGGVNYVFYTRNAPGDGLVNASIYYATSLDNDETWTLGGVVIDKSAAPPSMSLAGLWTPQVVKKGSTYHMFMSTRSQAPYPVQHYSLHFTSSSKTSGYSNAGIYYRSDSPPTGTAFNIIYGESPGAGNPDTGFAALANFTFITKVYFSSSELGNATKTLISSNGTVYKLTYTMNSTTGKIGQNTNATFTVAAMSPTSITISGISMDHTHTLAITYDGTDLVAYLDGEANGSPVTSSGSIAETSAFWVGGGGTPPYYAICSMYDVFVYNRALSAAEILSQYGGSEITTGLIHSYRFGSESLEDQTGEVDLVLGGYEFGTSYFGTVPDQYIHGLDPNVTMNEDGSYNLITTTKGATALSLFQTTDANLITWTYVKDVLAITAGWDDECIEGQFLILVDGTYYLFYCSGGYPEEMGLATSNAVDGEYTRFGADGKLDITPPFVSTTFKVSKPYVKYKDGIWVIFPCTYTDESRWEITSYWSDDLVTWEPYGVRTYQNGSVLDENNTIPAFSTIGVNATVYNTIFAGPVILKSGKTLTAHTCIFSQSKATIEALGGTITCSDCQYGVDNDTIFVDFNSGNYRLRPKSSAIDAGTNPTHGAGNKYDCFKKHVWDDDDDKVPSRYGPNVDIGACEKAKKLKITDQFGDLLKR